MQAVAAVLLLSLQSVPAGPGLAPEAAPSDTLFELEETTSLEFILFDGLLASTPRDSRSSSMSLDEIAEQMGINTAALKMIHRHPRAPETVEGVTLSPLVRDQLVQLYERSEVTGREQALCLGGQVRGATVHINRVRRPEIKDNSFLSVEYNGLSCLKPDFPFVGILHTHPTLVGISMCGFSMADQLNFVYMQRAIIDVVLCGPNQMVVMGHNQPPKEVLKLDQQVQVPSSPAAERLWTSDPLKEYQLLTAFPSAGPNE